VSKATLFHHFPSIDDIPLAAFDRLIEQMLDWPFADDATTEDRIAQLGAMTFAAVETHRDFFNAYFVFFGKAMFDERLRTRFRQSIKTLLARMEDVFSDADDIDRKALARLVAIVLDGLALHLLALDDAHEVERAWKLFQRVVSKGTSNGSRS
jgi:AcrR family transcriptional regulator